ncbi:MAG: hypothetical protein ACJAXA_002418 [Candidatus Aldehydirespiratoraceae bacterium]|jgi:hypothetical protein
MTDRDPKIVATETAERLAELADMAELMDDTDGAARLRKQAQAISDRAMQLLDE